MNLELAKEILGNCINKNDVLVIENNVVETLKFIINNYHFDKFIELNIKNNDTNKLEVRLKLYSSEDEEELIIEAKTAEIFDVLRLVAPDFDFD